MEGAEQLTLDHGYVHHYYSRFIDYHKQLGTTIFVTFLDTSKTFDKIDFCLLFQKLITKDFPVFIFKILAYWYCHQEMHVRWGSTFTSSFHVSNGVKQGGILSPMLFNVYMDQLSIRLNRSGIGGRYWGPFNQPLMSCR